MILKLLNVQLIIKFGSLAFKGVKKGNLFVAYLDSAKKDKFTILTKRPQQMRIVFGTRNSHT